MQPNPSKTQACRKCGMVFELSHFYTNHTYKTGHETACRACVLDYSRRRQEAKGPELREYHRKHYAEIREAKCRYEKEFRLLHGDAIRERKRQLYAANREAESERRKERLNVHGETIRGKRREYYKANSEAAITRAAAHKAKDPERWKQYSAEWRRQNADYMRLWIDAHPQLWKDLSRVNCRNYRARRTGNGGRHTKEQIRQLFAAQIGRCAACGADISAKFHADHIMPIKLGGSNDISNIQLLCPRCNLRKNAKHPDDWRRALGK